jgi:predicted N-formylglutamate amidohydrolase
MCKKANLVEKSRKSALHRLAQAAARLYIWAMLHTVPMNGMAVSLSADASYTILPGSLASGILLLCDHADNSFPAAYETLGLAPAQLQRHIAYDPGAVGITRHMSRILDAPAILTCYSRLLIDPNRGEDDPTLIMRISDGAVVPGNAELTPEERQKRLDLYYRPYHDAIDKLIDAMMQAGKPPVIISMHSFTENWRGWMRPWHAGVLWDRDPRLVLPLLEALRADPSLVVGDNEPYLGALRGDCVHKHSTMRGLANALIEIRQDLIRDDDGQAEWGRKLAVILERLLADPNADARFHTIRYYGSRTDPASCAAGGPGRENGMAKLDMDPKLATELEAAAFRRLVAHLREHSDVQNIDMMTLAGFCRNCLSNWYQEAAREKGVQLSKEEAREIIYGMPYEDWKALHQGEATREQQARFDSAGSQKNH